MRVLITGAEGFAGSHLAEHCLALGDEVWATCRNGAKVTNLAPVIDQLTLRVGDLAQPQFLRSLFEEARFDVVFHLAAISFLPEAGGSPVQAYEVNLLSGIRLLDHVRTLQPHVRVVLASSAEVYGAVKPELMPIVETLPFAPANVFAAGKAALELAAAPYVSIYGLDLVLARPFNHTGPRQRPDFVCSSFAEQVARAEAGLQSSISVGDLSARRDFSDVRDIVRGYRLLAQKGERGQAYNLASGHSVPVQLVLDTLLQLARVKNVEVKVDQARIRPTQVLDVRGSIEKIQQRTGWKPEIGLEKTLRDSLNWYRDWIARERK